MTDDKRRVSPLDRSCATSSFLDRPFTAMWCRKCQQDVPGVASLDGTARIACPRCGQDLRRTVRSDDAAGPRCCADAAGRVNPLPLLLDWQLEQDLDEARRIRLALQALGVHGSGGSSSPPQATDSTRYRLDAPHESPQPTAQFRDAVRATRSEPTLVRVVSKGLLWLGPLVLVVGLTLLVWTIAVRGEPLWVLCTPLISGGQLTIVVGLLMKVALLTQTRRRETLATGAHENRRPAIPAGAEASVIAGQPHLNFGARARQANATSGRADSLGSCRSVK